MKKKRPDVREWVLILEMIDPVISVFAETVFEDEATLTAWSHARHLYSHIMMQKFYNQVSSKLTSSTAQKYCADGLDFVHKLHQSGVGCGGSKELLESFFSKSEDLAASWANVFKVATRLGPHIVVDVGESVWRRLYRAHFDFSDSIRFDFDGLRFRFDST
eukprot:2211332-Pyramimonas_sp.AAC.1